MNWSTRIPALCILVLVLLASALSGCQSAETSTIAGMMKTLPGDTSLLMIMDFEKNNEITDKEGYEKSFASLSSFQIPRKVGLVMETDYQYMIMEYPDDNIANVLGEDTGTYEKRQVKGTDVFTLDIEGTTLELFTLNGFQIFSIDVEPETIIEADSSKMMYDDDDYKLVREEISAGAVTVITNKFNYLDMPASVGITLGDTVEAGETLIINGAFDFRTEENAASAMETLDEFLVEGLHASQVDIRQQGVLVIFSGELDIEEYDYFMWNLITPLMQN